MRLRAVNGMEIKVNDQSQTAIHDHEPLLPFSSTPQQSNLGLQREHFLRRINKDNRTDFVPSWTCWQWWWPSVHTAWLGQHLVLTRLSNRVTPLHFTHVCMEIQQNFVLYLCIIMAIIIHIHKLKPCLQCRLNRWMDEQRRVYTTDSQWHLSRPDLSWSTRESVTRRSYGWGKWGQTGWLSVSEVEWATTQAPGQKTKLLIEWDTGRQIVDRKLQRSSGQYNWWGHPKMW